MCGSAILISARSFSACWSGWVCSCATPGCAPSFRCEARLPAILKNLDIAGTVKFGKLNDSRTCSSSGKLEDGHVCYETPLCERGICRSRRCYLRERCPPPTESRRRGEVRSHRHRQRNVRG